MKILITGVSGLVGSALAAKLLREGYIVAGCGRASDKPLYLPEKLEYAHVDLSDAVVVHEYLRNTLPDVIVHAAAISKPNDCELNPGLCRLVNVDATQHLLQGMPSTCYFLFISTDFVFGHEGPYKEDDAYDPVNVYGQSKMEAEQLVIQMAKHYGIVRTVLVYGKPLNQAQATFPQWVTNQLAEKDSIRVFTDQRRTATYLNDLIWALCKMIKHRQQGAYHICGEEVWSPFEMAVEVAKHLKLDTTRIHPITRNDMQEPALRPRRSTLSIDKAKSDLSYNPVAFNQVLHNLF